MSTRRSVPYLNVWWLLQEILKNISLLLRPIWSDQICDAVISPYPRVCHRIESLSCFVASHALLHSSSIVLTFKNDIKKSRIFDWLLNSNDTLWRFNESYSHFVNILTKIRSEDKSDFAINLSTTCSEWGTLVRGQHQSPKL